MVATKQNPRDTDKLSRTLIDAVECVPAQHRKAMALAAIPRLIEWIAHLALPAAPSPAPRVRAKVVFGSVRPVKAKAKAPAPPLKRKPGLKKVVVAKAITKRGRPVGSKNKSDTAKAAEPPLPALH